MYRKRSSLYMQPRRKWLWVLGCVQTTYEYTYLYSIFIAIFQGHKTIIFLQVAAHTSSYSMLSPLTSQDTCLIIIPLGPIAPISVMMSLPAMSFGDRFYFSRKGEIGWGEWVHPKGTKSMVTPAWGSSLEMTWLALGGPFQSFLA